MIQVSEVAADKAALQIADVLDSEGGRWLVNAVEDEGFVMARVGTLECKRLERSGSPNLAGPFDARWLIAYIAEELRAAQMAGRYVRAVEVTPRSRKPKSRVELIARILDMLTTGEKGVAYMERVTGASNWTIRATLSRLVRAGEVAKRKEWGGTTLYRLAMRERQVA